MSCLFHSIGHLLSLPADEVRQTICNYLQDNKPVLEGFDTHELCALERPGYIQAMRNASTWGGAIEIQAACSLWLLRVLVLNHRDHKGPIEFVPVSGEPTRTFTLSWTGGHYEPVHACASVTVTGC
jgi:hypothetical protein